MRLNELSDNPGARHSKKRVGRGIGSGTGKTAGKGHKGAKARSGVAINAFEGGQMPLYRRLPKRGFKNPFRKHFAVVNLDTLQAAVDSGKLKAGGSYDAKSLCEAGVIRRVKDGVRLLANGELNAGLNLSIAGASSAAVDAVKKAGGSVELPAAAE